MLCEYFADTCVVGVHDDRIVGFATGFRLPADDETLFIWQIVTSDEARSTGIASRMLDHLTERPLVPRLRYLQATVTPGNEPSLRLFRGFATRRGAPCDETPLFARDDFPEGHEPEVQLRIGPF
jgi:L-2,4-diaminobutyric acid acetyltransferase